MRLVPLVGEARTGHRYECHTVPECVPYPYRPAIDAAELPHIQRSGPCRLCSLTTARRHFLTSSLSVLSASDQFEWLRRQARNGRRVKSAVYMYENQYTQPLSTRPSMWLNLPAIDEDDDGGAEENE